MYKSNTSGLFGRTMKPFPLPQPIRESPANLDLPDFPKYQPATRYGGNPGFAPPGFANGGLVQQVEQNIYKKSKKFQK